MTNFIRSSVRAVVAFITAISPLAAQTGVPSQFIMTKGKDTVGVEIFSRDGATLTSEIHIANGPRWQITANVKPDGAIDRVEATRAPRQGAPVGLIVSVGDTLIRARMTAAGISEDLDVAARGKRTPFLAISFALTEQVVRASRLPIGGTAQWTAVRLGAADTASLTVSRFHADSVLVTGRDIELRVALSREGEITGGRHVLQDWIFTRKRSR
jgi:hypothetical protein